MIELFKNVVIMSIIGSLLTLLLVVIRPITEKKFSAKWHYETKKLILLFFVIPMTAMMDINITNLNKSYNSDVIINNETFEKEVNKDNNEEVNKERFDNLKPLEDNQVKSDVRVISKDTINKVINIWIIGMIFFLCWYIYCYLRFSIEIKKYCKFLKEDSDLMKLISGLRKELNLKQSFKVYNSKILDSPLVTGFFNRKLILPDNLKDDINIKPILMHELTHIRRGDLTIKFAITLISIIHWFNPFIYLLKREIDEYCELSCDEGITVNMSQKERKEYGESILKVIENISFSNSSSFATGFNGNKKYIKRRLIMILNSKKQKRRTIILAGCVLGVVIIGGIGATKLILSKANNNIVLKETDNKDLAEEAVVDDKEVTNEETTVEEVPVVKEETPMIETNVVNDSDKNEVKLDVKDVDKDQKPKEEVPVKNTNVQNNNKEENSDVFHYVNTKFGFSFDFPKSWEGKYRIIEEDYGVYVCAIPATENDYKHYGELFFLIKADSDVNPDHIDTVGDLLKEQNINGVKMYLGGPTGLGISDDDGNYPIYHQLSKEKYAVTNTLKVIKK